MSKITQRFIIIKFIVLRKIKLNPRIKIRNLTIDLDVVISKFHYDYLFD